MSEPNGIAGGAVNRQRARIPRRGRRGEQGFAMLFVFLMAAIVAIMLYSEVPRLTFDAQRTREKLLITRGEEYKRGIYMFFKATKRYPAKIEELESFNNQRFLRRRFTDPMTGSKDWRLVHIQNGVLTDSLVTKPPGANDQNQNPTNFQYGASTAGGDWNNGQGQNNAAVVGAALANRRRASDSMPLPGMASNNDGTTPPADPNNPNPPNPNPQNPAIPGMPGYTGGIPQQPGAVNGQPVPLPPGVVVPPGVPGVPGQVPGQIPGQFPGQVPGQVPGQTPTPTQTTSSPYSGSSYMSSPATTALPTGQPGSYPMPTQPYPGGQGQFPGQPVNGQAPLIPGANGAPGFQQPGVLGGVPGQGGPNQAQQMIQQILTSPRPGGAPIGGMGGMGQMIGGGIAGVASNADAASIKVYNDHSNYKEWEFIFDPTKMQNVPNPLSGAVGTPASALGSTGGQQIGTPASSLGSGFGSTGSSGFGSSGFGSSGSSSFGGTPVTSNGPGFNQPVYTPPPAPGTYTVAVPGQPQTGTPTFVPDIGVVIKH